MRRNKLLSRRMSGLHPTGLVGDEINTNSWRSVCVITPSWQLVAWCIYVTKKSNHFLIANMLGSFISGSVGPPYVFCYKDGECTRLQM